MAQFSRRQPFVWKKVRSHENNEDTPGGSVVNITSLSDRATRIVIISGIDALLGVSLVSACDLTYESRCVSLGNIPVLGEHTCPCGTYLSDRVPQRSVDRWRLWSAWRKHLCLKGLCLKGLCLKGMRWRVSLHGHSFTAPRLWKIVPHRVVMDSAIVPEHNGSSLPSHSTLQTGIGSMCRYNMSRIAVLSRFDSSLIFSVNGSLTNNTGAPESGCRITTGWDALG